MCVIVKPIGVEVFVGDACFLSQKDCYFDVFAWLEGWAKEFWLRHGEKMSCN